MNYTYDMDMSSAFSVIYTEYDITNTSSINYTLTGLDQLTLYGTWASVTYNVTGYDFTNSAAGTFTSYQVTVTAFIASSTQINGLDGIIGMAPVHMFEEL